MKTLSNMAGSSLGCGECMYMEDGDACIIISLFRHRRLSFETNIEERGTTSTQK